MCSQTWGSASALRVLVVAGLVRLSEMRGVKNEARRRDVYICLSWVDCVVGLLLSVRQALLTFVISGA